MNYESAIMYVEQRMKKLGKTPDQYHWYHKYALGTQAELSAGYFEIKAYNELFILLKPEIYTGLLILADNSAFNSDDVRLNGVNEFTGLIRFIQIGAGWNLSAGGDNGMGAIQLPLSVEFIKVVIY